MTSNETARTMIGYLMVRSGVHQAAYALALRKLTGVEVTKMLAVPNIDDDKIPEARKWQEIGNQLRLYTFSPKDYTDVASVWSGPADRADGRELEVMYSAPHYAAEGPAVGECESLFSPDYAPEEIYEITAKMMNSGGISPNSLSDGKHSRGQKGPVDSPDRGKSKPTKR